MNAPILYRKRLIPDETLLLKNDTTLYRDDDKIITCWNTIHPKKDLHHGLSCYLLRDGIKVSKFCTRKNELLCWYCDIVSHTYDADTDTYVFTDLLTDVLVYPDGHLRVADLDELADVVEQDRLPRELLLKSLRQTDRLLSRIQDGSFSRIQELLNTFERTASVPLSVFEGC